MPHTNFCKKCNAETPVADACPRCGAKLTRAGERLSITVTRAPVRDWFSWNAMLRVVVPDIAAYDAFYKRLIAKIEIRDVSSSFAMEQIKHTSQLPLDYMVLDKESSSNAA